MQSTSKARPANELIFPIARGFENVDIDPSDAKAGSRVGIPGMSLPASNELPALRAALSEGLEFVRTRSNLWWRFFASSASSRSFSSAKAAHTTADHLTVHSAGR